MSKYWKSYNALLATNPIATKSLTSFTGFLIGDVLAQTYIEPKDTPYDYKRTARLSSFGLLIHGPSSHFFYKALDAKFPGTSPMTIVKKVTIDQTIWNPIFALMYFGYLTATTASKTFSDYKETLQHNFKAAVVGSWTVWIPSHIINFALIPPSQRVLYINFVQVGYNVFLSVLGNRGGLEEEEERIVEGSGKEL